MFNKSENLKVEDLYEMIEHAGVMTSSSDDIHKFNKHPTHIYIHELISKFTKEELESYYKRFKDSTLFSLCLSKKSYIAYASLLEKGAFLDHLSNEQKWLLNNIRPLTLDVYQAVQHLHKYNQSANSDHKDSTFLYVFKLAIEKTNEKDRTANIEKFINSYGKELFDLIHSDFTYVKFFAPTLIKKGFNINKNFPLNKYLPNNGRHDSFFISSLHTADIKTMLELGYKFDEENYRYQNDTLMTCILKSKRIDLLEFILPYLTKFEPADKQKHYDIIDNYKDKKVSADIMTKYNYYLLQNSLDETSNVVEKKKLKL